MVSEWKPFNDVSIITYIFPNVPYHYRIHVVNTKYHLNYMILEQLFVKTTH